MDDASQTAHRYLHAADVSRVADLLDDNPDAVVTVTDTEGRLLWGSRAGSERLFDRRPADYAGREIWPYVHRDDHPRVAGALELAADGKTVRFTCRASRADGSWQRVGTVAWRSHLRTGEIVLLHITVPLPDDGGEGAEWSDGAGEAVQGPRAVYDHLASVTRAGGAGISSETRAP